MSTQSLDSDIYDYGFILNSTALHEAAMSVLVITIYGRWRGTTTTPLDFFPNSEQIADALLNTNFNTLQPHLQG